MAIILASQSPRRKELLGYLVPEFQVLPADIDETIQAADVPEEYVLRMAREKARAIAKTHPNDLVIASDTIVVVQNKILGKPASREEAFEMLASMSGATHQVYTAVVMCSNDTIKERIVPANVTFFALTEAEINHYLDQEEYQDKAGAYGIQGKASVFVQRVDGDYYSIVGFPVGVVNQMLKEFTEV
ncbi:MAG: Maf family protein [Enterococcus sp.]